MIKKFLLRSIIAILIILLFFVPILFFLHISKSIALILIVTYWFIGPILLWIKINQNIIYESIKLLVGIYIFPLLLLVNTEIFNDVEVNNLYGLFFAFYSGIFIMLSSFEKVYKLPEEMKKDGYFFTNRIIRFIEKYSDDEKLKKYKEENQINE